MATKKVKVDPLPDTLSGLIKVALKDLKKAEATKGYKIDMDDWHSLSNDGKVCSVCYAGSVMAFSLGASRFNELHPASFWNGLGNKLDAINHLRCGEIIDAANCIHGDALRLKAMAFFDEHQSWLETMPVYQESKKGRDAFHAAQAKLARLLAKAGL